ncbi:MAG TPA: hypothetical protein DD979_16105 [Gammaproteobacteria bacterium]|jgi:hypothetical protein|nr:hypothetical protein [Gammaproteobacteria bacterium]
MIIAGIWPIGGLYDNMLNKLLFAFLMVALVLVYGDPYAPENRNNFDYLPPAPDESVLLQLKQDSAEFFEDVDVRGWLEHIAEHELTRDALAFAERLKTAVLQKLLTWRDDDALVAQLNQSSE